MSDDTSNISTIGLPACLGGEPVREPGTFRTTPERDQQEADFLSKWVRGATNWEPDAPNGGVALGEGLQLARALTLDAEILNALGWEPAAAAAEFGAIHAPGRNGLTFVPNNNGTRIITAVFAALTKWAEEMGLRTPQVGDEVIVPVATWQATAGALLSRNLVPVLVDVDPATLTISPDAIANALTDRTVGIVPVHLYGRMAEMDTIMAIANERNLFVLEDCAHAHGAVFGGGRPAGTIGHAGTFSMQGSKTLSCGEGGMAVSRFRALALQIASIVTCGRQLPGTEVFQADNDRLPAPAAALLRAQLRRFPEQKASRVDVFARMDELELPGVTPLARQASVDVQPTYKQLFRFDLSRFGGMSLQQLAKALEAELGAEFAEIYTPLNASRLYTPHSDVANKISADYWTRIDAARFDAPVAAEAFRTVLAIEHASGLDPEFPNRFAKAVGKIQAHAERIARELTV